jgi:hypothetical protein
MKRPDHLFHDLGVLEFLIKFWVLLPFALACLFGAASFVDWIVSEPGHVLAATVTRGAQAAMMLLVIVGGGRLLVSLFQIAGDKPLKRRSSRAPRPSAIE